MEIFTVSSKCAAFSYNARENVALGGKIKLCEYFC